MLLLGDGTGHTRDAWLGLRAAEGSAACAGVFLMPLSSKTGTK